VARLNQALAGRQIILISAPTGCGKTSLVGEWLNHLQFTTIVPIAKPTGIDHLPLENEKVVNRQSKIINRVAWLSLDPADNDPARFLAYSIAALQTAAPGLGQTSLALLNSPQLLAAQADLTPLNRLTPTQPPPPSDFFAPDSPLNPPLVALVNDLAGLSTDIVLVLDDYHVIDSPIIHQMLTFLLDNIPPPLHLVILSRTDPPLPLPHWRARGNLLELHTQDLRFNLDETTTFFNQVMALSLSADDIKTLEVRTEGWVAGLQLAALSLQGREQTHIADFMASFSGSHRYILDYLATEVLQRQPAALQEFLLRTSILDRLCGPLCDTVLEMRDWGLEIRNTISNLKSPISPTSSQKTLEQLEAANLFIIPLDDERRWYRYHHLFAELLRSRLQNHLSSSEIVTLHHRAADWFEQQGLVAEAMRHALTAADAARSARLLEQHARTLISRSEMATLLSWFNHLPAELVRTEAQLSLFQAWALVFTGQLEAAEALLQDAPAHSGEVTAIQGTIAYLRRNMPQAITLYRQALSLLPPDNLFLRGAVALSLGIALSWSGQVIEADPVLAQAAAISQATGNLHVALTALWNQALLALEQGQLGRAAGLCQHALHLASTKNVAGQMSNLPDQVVEHPRSPLPAVGGAYVVLGNISYEQNNLAAAADYFDLGIDLGEQAADLTIVSLGYLGLARVRQAQVNPTAALKLIRQAEQLARQFNSPYWLAQTAAAEARIRLEQGQPEAAQQWAQTTHLNLDTPSDYLHEAEQLTLVRLWLKTPGDKAAKAQRSQAFSRFLDQMLALTERDQRLGRVIELLTLQAVAFYLEGRLEPALTSLTRALSLAEPEGYIRLFVDEDPPMAQLLSILNRRTTPLSQTYLTNLLVALNESKSVLPEADDTSSRAKEALPSSPPLVHHLVEPLSERELALLHLIAEGMSNQEIADKLVVTVGTVKWHLNNIYGKMGVRSRTQAVARGRELGLL
jgi:LuxR family maltose regulon positive regulatory protein